MAVDLLEFQRGLWSRLQKARTADAESARLGVASGGERWLLPLIESDSVLPLQPVAPVPAVQPWYCGLVNIRGNLYGVIDFSMYLGGTPTVRNMNARLVVVAQTLRVNAALMVSQMLGLQNLNKLTRRPIEGAAPAWLHAEYEAEDGARWRELNLSALTSEERFMKVAAN